MTYTAPPELWAAERIIELIEKGNLPPWRKSWSMSEAGLPKNMLRLNKPYKGMNLWLLLMAPYEKPFYLTIKQIKELGGRFKEGEKPWPVHFWSVKRETMKDGTEKTHWFCKGYKVWNVEQCEGIDPDKIPPIPNPAEEFEHEPLVVCECIVDGLNNPPKILYKGQQPRYTPAIDTITMTPMKRFKEQEEFYSTLFHEIAHSTGHASRLNRKGIADFGAFGDHAYSEEELVAEFTASMLCARAGIANQVIENSAAYIDNWLKRLKSDPKMLVVAMKAADKAFRYIVNETALSGEDSSAEDAAQ